MLLSLWLCGVAAINLKSACTDNKKSIVSNILKLLIAKYHGYEAVLKLRARRMKNNSTIIIKAYTALTLHSALSLSTQKVRCVARGLNLVRQTLNFCVGAWICLGELLLGSLLGRAIEGQGIAGMHTKKFQGGPAASDYCSDPYLWSALSVGILSGSFYLCRLIFLTHRAQAFR